MGGYIMQLQNYSVNDGDGIRTVIFWRAARCGAPGAQTRKGRPCKTP